MGRFAKPGALDTVAGRLYRNATAACGRGEQEVAGRTMSDVITVFGGSGFIGRHTVAALQAAGKRVRIAVRRPHLAHEASIGRVGEVQVVQANLRDPESVRRAVEGATGVVNLVGILAEGGKQTFAAIQAQGAAEAAKAAAAAGVDRFVQVSAIGADANSKSAYARSKAEAEAAVRAAIPAAVILRPSVVFGPEDGFLNRFAAMARSAPALPLIGGGRTRFQPVYVGDVAAAIVAGLDNPEARGRTFELGGPNVYTFREILDFIQRETQRKRPYARLPFGVAGLMGAAAGTLLRLVPIAEPPITADQVEMLKSDNLVGLSGDPTIGTLKDLGVTELETMEVIAPTYLWRFRPYGQFSGPASESGA